MIAPGGFTMRRHLRVTPALCGSVRRPRHAVEAKLQTATGAPTVSCSSFSAYRSCVEHFSYSTLLFRFSTSSALSSPKRQAGSRGGAHHYRPFTADDETQLAAVLTTKPRHVARHIRQSMLQSRRRISQFRNAVTYLMILLQSQLQKKEISPKDATIILENIMRECVDLRQGDMAHLLFRAAIRFRKYDVQVGYPLVRHLFDSYRLENAKELMKNMAEELRNDPALRFIAVLSFQLSDEHEKAMSLLAEIPTDTLQTSDFCALIDSFGSTAAYEDITKSVAELLEKEPELCSRGVQIDSILSTAIVCLRGDPPRMRQVRDTAVGRRAKLSDAALGALLRCELNAPFRVKSPADVYEVEKQLREELHVDSLGAMAETTLIAKCSELMSRGHELGDDLMLAKVKHIQSVIETAIENDEVDELDSMYALSLIKGFGVLGKFEEMRSCFDKMQAAGIVKDHRLYDEMLKWYAFAYNLKEVIALKEEMTRKNIFHTSFTYHNVFRVLDKYYPRMVEKYLAEMRTKGMNLEGFMYPTLIRVFGELQDVSMVESLYSELKGKAANGNRSAMTPLSVIQMLKCFHTDAERCAAILGDAEQYGLLSNDNVQAEVIRLYSDQGRNEELRSFLARVPHKSAGMYSALLRHAAKKRDKDGFKKLLSEIHDSHIAMSERLLSTIITSLSHFNDAEGVKEYAARAMALDEKGIHTPLFFADCAAAYARLGDSAAVDRCWKDLVDSSMIITMPVYNRFLDLYMGQNNMAKVQEILDTMMKLVPPNPVTATTVVDMLGKMGRLTEMEAVLDEMSKSANAVPTLVTYHQAMNAYAKCGDVTKMEEVRERLKQEGFKENHVTYNILFEGYGRAKRSEHLQELLEERRQKNIPMEEYGFVVLLGHYARARMGPEAEALVEEMVASGLSFTGRMLATIATSFSIIGNIPLTEHYVSLLLASSDCNLRDVESIYLIYSRARDTVKLQELLDNTALPRSEFIYNICVGAFARAAEHSKVAFLLMEMERLGYTLSRNTSVTLSSLLLKAGKLELAQTVLRWKGLHTESAGLSTKNDAAVDAANVQADKSSSSMDSATQIASEVKTTDELDTGDVTGTLLHSDAHSQALQEQLRAEMSALHGKAESAYDVHPL